MPCNVIDKLKTLLKSFAVIAVFGSKSVVALSCVPITDSYYLLCNSGQCSAKYMVREIAAFGACGRRPIVNVISPNDQEFLESTVQLSKSFVDDGLYKVEIQIPYWHRKVKDETGTFKTTAKHMLERYRRNPEYQLTDFDAGDFAKILDTNFSQEWLTQISYNSDDLKSIETTQSKRVWKGRAWHYGSNIFNWGTALIALMVLLISTQTFFQRLFKPDLTESESLVLPVILQICVLVVASTSLLFSTFHLWPGAVLAPAAMVILVSEFWSKWKMRNGI